MNLNHSVFSRIGNTPIIKILTNYKDERINGKNIYAKLEMTNPGFSVKDRIAYKMIKSGILEGKINKDTLIIEPTSGNTGIGLALVCAALKLKLILVMPETMSKERRVILKHLGADVILSEGSKGMFGAVELALNIANEKNNVFIPNQFENLNNPKAHMETTAVEFLNFINQNEIYPNAFIFGVGTGGTLTGVSEVILQYFPNTLICAVEPKESPVLSGGKAGTHGIMGIGAGFIPKILNKNLINKVVCVSTEEAYYYCRLISKEEGLLIGISSGAILAACFEVAKDLPEGANIFTLFPDSTERYLSLL